jgi:hypothetical protein
LWEKYGKWQDMIAWKALNGHIGKEDIIYEIHKNMNKGRIPSPETREKMAAAKRGKKITIEHKKALNEGRKKSKNRPEHIVAIKQFNTGRKMSKDSIQKSIESRKRNNDTKELARHAGKISAEKYKNDPIRQKAHSERMKLWWDERRKVGT